MLRRIVVVLAMASVAVGGATALLAAPAGARVPTASLCNSLKNLHYTPSSDPTATGGRSNAKKLAKAFNNIAKKAKGDLKAALKTMAKYFTDAANLDTTALQNDSQPFASAVSRFSNYLVQSCTAGLPGGVTIPTIPSH
jgi:gas vesicle protein